MKVPKIKEDESLAAWRERLGKIDPIHGLLDALYCFDWSEGRIES